MMYYTTPEQAGIPSAAVERFIDRLEAKGLCMHSFMMVKNGGILAEGYWKPMTADRKHRMYSVSKSFVSLAIGIMAGEGLIRLDDRIADYFPEKLPANPHPYLMEMTIRDLLRMSTAHSVNTYGEHDPDWIATFFRREPDVMPGRVFSYNTSGTTVLNALVEKVTGLDFLEYLKPRLLEPLGVSKDIWCVQRPEGGPWGGSGVICTPMDLAKVALCCLHGGRHEGVQLIPEWYVREATSRQIDNRVENGGPELCFGYGYQFWCTRNGGFTMYGMGSQLAVCVPQYEFMLVTTADTQECPTGTNDVLDALWTEIYPWLGGDLHVPADHAAIESLKKRIDGLHILPEKGGAASGRAKEWSGRRFVMDKNPMGIKWLQFDFEDGTAVMTYENEQGPCELKFAIGGLHAQKFPQKNYYGERIGVKPGLQYDCLCTAAWADEASLAAHVWIVDNYFGSARMHFAFEGDTVTVYMKKQAEWFLNEYEGFASGRVDA